MSRLQLQRISKTFPGVKALQDVDFAVEAGEIHALCGENGAGKSTLMNVLSGNLQPDQGNIFLNKPPVKIPSPIAAFDLGIAIVHQHLSLIDSLSVAENIFANQQPRNRWGLIQFDQLYQMAGALLQQMHIQSIHPKTIVMELSPPEKQLVEIAKALSKKPSILILDEPTASLTDREIKVLFALLAKLQSEGVSIIYISHRLNEIFQLADRVTVLKDGKSQGTFVKNELDKGKLIKLMVGREVIDIKSESVSTGDVLLDVRNLTTHRLNRISFQLHKGEIIGLAGLIGAGRTEIARAVFGADEMESGDILLSNEMFRPRHPKDAIKNGIAYVPEDRKLLGLFAEMSIKNNIVSASLPAITRGKWYSNSIAEQLSLSLKEQLRISTSDTKNLVSTLSGGNQQKVVLAKWLLTHPQLLIVDEPTHGIDVGSKFEIYAILQSLAKEGKGIIIISSELPELIGLCDRILVIRNGNLVGEVKGMKRPRKIF